MLVARSHVQNTKPMIQLSQVNAKRKRRSRFGKYGPSNDANLLEHVRSPGKRRSSTTLVRTHVQVPI
jgi:hypothetical protein